MACGGGVVPQGIQDITPLLQSRCLPAVRERLPQPTVWAGGNIPFIGHGFRYADVLAQFYNGYQEGATHPNLAQYSRLNETMSEATQAIFEGVE